MEFLLLLPAENTKWNLSPNKSLFTKVVKSPWQTTQIDYSGQLCLGLAGWAHVAMAPWGPLAILDFTKQCGVPNRADALVCAFCSYLGNCIRYIYRDLLHTVYVASIAYNLNYTLLYMYRIH